MLATEISIPFSNGQSFFALDWSPSGEPKGLIVLVHGLSDHAGRYHHVGQVFAEAGLALFCPDLRGNGRSFGKRGHFPSYGLVMDDIALFIETARLRHPSLPVFLYGHSMGGNLVLNFLIRRQPAVAGAIVTSPWLRLAMKPPLFKLVLALVLSRIAPSLSQPDGIFPGYLSHDDAVARAYEADPLVHSRISVRTFAGVSRAGEFAMAHANEMRCPLLLMHGTGDRITSFEASREFSGRLQTDHTFRAWEGMAHELHNETCKEEVIREISGWIGGVIHPATPGPSG